MANTKVKAEQLEAAQTNITSLGTLTSLTISGDLTVDTSTLKVDSSNNRVGIGTGSPAYETQIYSADDTDIFDEMLKRNPQARTVPQIFIDDILIGGYTDLVEKFSE